MKHPDPSLVNSPANIIVLNGTSSSGKSSLAKAMQLASETPLHHVQADTFRKMEPPGYWDGWDKRDETSIQQMLRALCGATYAAVLQYACHGQHVILDVALTNPHARHLLVEYLQGWPVHLVGVHCALPELERRECARGDRNLGLAASQFDWLHRHMLYDLQIDTTDKPADHLAEEVLTWLADTSAPTALDKMYAQTQASLDH